MSSTEFIFVYNADTGRLNAYMDILHKMISPSTYPCSLCAITHGTFTKKKEWADFLERSNLSMTFLHKDEWDRQDQLPAIFTKDADGRIEQWLGAEEIAKLNLTALLTKLETYNQM